MSARIGRVLIVLAALAIPLHADLSGITTSPANLPSKPSEMTVGGGYLWILSEAGNLGRMAPGGTYVEYPLQFGTDQNGIPNASNLAYGFDGNMWVSGFNGHVDRITPAGVVTDFAAVGINEQTNIVSGADNAMWFFYIPRFGSTSDNSSKLARIDIYGQVTTYPLGLGTDYFGSLVKGGDGNLWFMDTAKSAVEKFSIGDHTVSSYPLPTTQNGGGNGVLGLDGNVWFTHGAAIDRVKPDGTITEFPIPSGGQPTDIAVAGDGNIWFAEYSAGKIGQLIVSSITSGGSATISESGAILPNGETLLLVPSAFAPNSAGKTGDLDKKPCLLTFLSKKTPPTAGVWVTVEELEPCSDINMQLFSLHSSYAAIGFIYVSNDGPDPAPGFTATCTVTAVKPGSSIINVQTSDPTVMASVSGLTLTFTKASVNVGDYVYVSFQLKSADNSPITSASATAVAGSANGDPNFTNNALDAFFTDNIAVALPRDVNAPVISYVQRGH